MVVDSIPALAAAVFIAGLFFAPTMILAMTLIERLVPERQLTEGMTWLLAGLNIGVALGAAASGQIVDWEGAQAGFTLALAGGVGVLIVALWASIRLRTQTTSALSAV
jgi:predicted MFS family arabinose efflux permease